MVVWLLTLLGYFVPMWIAIFYYSVPKKIKKYFALGMFFVWGVSIPLMIIERVFHVFSLQTGFWNVLIWQTLFGVVFLILTKKNYEFYYSVFIAFLVTVIATEIWEIPIHFLTITMNPTAWQIFMTTTLAVPYLILIIPLMREMKKQQIFNSPSFFIIYLSISVLLGLLFWILPSNNTAIFQPSGYPTNELNYFMRIFWSLMFLLLMLMFPKVKKT